MDMGLVLRPGVMPSLAQVAHELDFFVDFHAPRQRDSNVFGSGSVVFAM